MRAIPLVAGDANPNPNPIGDASAKMKMQTRETTNVPLMVVGGKRKEVELVRGGKGLSNRMYEQLKMKPTWDSESKKMLKRLDEGDSSPVFAGSTFPLFDAADAVNRGFNVTISSKKAITLALVREVRKNLGLDKSVKLHIVYILPPGRSTYFNVSLPTSKSDKAELDNLIKLYVVDVPSANDETWKECAVGPMAKQQQEEHEKEKGH